MKTIKKGGDYTACYDAKNKRYVAYIVQTDREGQTRNMYEITKEIFDRLGSGNSCSDLELSRKGRHLYYFENTMYGTPGPVESVYDDDYKEIWKQAYLSATGEEW